MQQSWWLYLLACRDGRTYAGIALDLQARYELHVLGKGAKFTRSNPPVRLLGAQLFQSRSDALRAEAALKRLNRTQRLGWARLHPRPDGAEDNVAGHREEAPAAP